MLSRAAAIPAAASIYYFEPFVLDARSGELRRGRDMVVLQEQPFRILRRLVESAGAVVGREDLCRVVWADGTCVDYEHGLNAAIRRLRRALVDDAAEPRFIETIPRRGYRLLVPVTAGGGDGQRALRVRTDRARLAVLPLSSTQPAGTFADGLVEELMVQVGRLSGDAVALVARSASLRMTTPHVSSGEIGTALRADYVLEGSVRLDGARVRVAAWLVDTSTETHVWADAVDADVGSPLAAQVEIAARLARSLDGMLRQAS